MDLTTAQKNFIIHWGEMGTRWGINRTVAQIHALLYLTPEPLTADEISETLSIARSTVSTGLHELQGWNIVRVVHVLGDRRDHFESMSDVWEMFRVVLDERKRREIDPALEMLRETIAHLDEQPHQEEPYTRQKLVKMLDFFETIDSLYDQIRNMPLSSIKRVVRFGDSLNQLLELAAEK